MRSSATCSPHASTWIRTSPSPAVGRGTCSYVKGTSRPCATQRAARMVRGNVAAGLVMPVSHDPLPAEVLDAAFGVPEEIVQDPVRVLAEGGYAAVEAR